MVLLNARNYGKYSFCNLVFFYLGLYDQNYHIFLLMNNMYSTAELFSLVQFLMQLFCSVLDYDMRGCKISVVMPEKSAPRAPS
jgi:hypothetical protein